MRRILALALLLALPSTGSAYDIAQLTKDVRAYQESMMKKLGDVTMEQEATISRPDKGSTTVHTKMYRKGLRWRNEGSMAMPGSNGDSGATMQTVQVFDGEEIWSVSMGMKMKLPRERAARQGSPAYWMDPAPGSKIAGEEKVAGHDCWIVEGPEAPADAGEMAGSMRTWIDKKTFVPVQTESEAAGHKIRAVFSDFRKVQGFDMPYQTEVFTDGTATMTAKVVKVETNQGLSDDLFDPAKLEGSEMGTMGATGMPKGMDMNAIMKQAEAMKKQMEEAQKQQGGE